MTYPHRQLSSPATTNTRRRPTLPTSPTRSASSPPFFDDKYGQIRVTPHPPQASTDHKAASREEALAYAKEQLDRYRENDDYPIPRPENTYLFVSPGYEHELAVSELFGNASLGTFVETDETPTPIEQAGDWYRVTDAYETWLAPIHPDGPKANHVLTYTRSVLSRWETFWVRLSEDQHGDRHATWLRYRHSNHGWTGPDPAELSKVTRALKGIGINYELPGARPQATVFPDGTTTSGAIGVAHVPFTESPFADDYTHPYLENSPHPNEVNGWNFTPNGRGRDTWRAPDGYTEVHVMHNGVRIAPRTIWQDLSAEYLEYPAAAPDPRKCETTPRTEARNIAIDWMQQHPAEDYAHPLDAFAGALFTHPIDDAEDLNRWYRERKGALTCKVQVDLDGPHAPADDDLATYYYEIKGDATPSPDIDVAHTTGFTATRVWGEEPRGRNAASTTLTEGSFVDALDAVSDDLLSDTAPPASRSNVPTSFIGSLE